MVFASFSDERTWADVGGMVPVRGIFVAVISRQRQSEQSFNPRRRAPAIPDRGLHIVRGPFPYQDGVRTLLGRIAGDTPDFEVLGPWEC